MSRAPPKPPKYLIVTDNAAKTSFLRVEDLINQHNQANLLSQSSAVEKYPIQRHSILRNSKTDVKDSSISNDSSRLRYENYHDITTRVSTSNHFTKARGPPPKAPALSTVSSSHSNDTYFEPSLEHLPSKLSSTIKTVVSVGPQNPSQVLSDEWTCYWDFAAGAAYYYNQITGEATWIRPSNV